MERLTLSIFFKTFTGFVFLFFLLAVSVHAQKVSQVEIVNADTFEGDESLGKNVSRLLGNVSFRQQEVLMYCDSAYLYQETNSLDAFGHIRILQGDSINLTGDLLKYDGNIRQAKLTGKVVMTDKEMILRTNILNYNLISETAEYFEGAEITDKENVLTSKKGYYFSQDKTVFFKDSVVLVNPKYIIRADTLKYRTDTEVAIFEGPTRIFSTGKDSTVMYCENGWYNTKTEKSLFKKNAIIVSKENRLAGDSLLYDNKLTVGNAYSHVSLTDTIQKVIISGNYGFTDDRNKFGFVTGHAVLTKIFEQDSLFLHADTLFARQDTVSKNKSWTAHKGVRIYKTDLQGKCDSLVYNSADSIIAFYHDPVLWSEANQLSATFMNMQLANSKMSELHLIDAAFITSREDSLRFNQIKGRDMTGFFVDNKLSSIKVEGNGQSVYYTKNSKKQFTGVNRAECSDMFIVIEESKIKTITMINEPDATLYPINELTPNELRLKGFLWKEGERPVNKEDIFRLDRNK